MTGRRSTLAVAAMTTLAASLAGTVALVAGSAPSGRLEVTALSVGSAAAVLVRTADGAVAVVDGGSDPDRLTAALGRSLPPTTRTLDLVVLTGGERAAVAGLAGLHGRYAVRRVVIPVAQMGTGARTILLALRADGAAVTAIPTDASWAWDGVTFRCVAPALPDVDQPGPVTPVCALQLSAGHGCALLLGDMPPPDQDALASGWGSGLRCDLLVSPPGGALAPALVDAVRPRDLAVPALRPPRIAGLPDGLDVRTTAGGEITYAAGPGGMGPA